MTHKELLNVNQGVNNDTQGVTKYEPKSYSGKVCQAIFVEAAILTYPGTA